jgi:hypothetical protein
MSPRVQVAVNLFFNVACVLKLVIVGKGFYLDNFVTFLGAFICQPAHAVLSEKYSRRAFKERRIAEALLDQQRAATRAQLGVLRSLVPSEVVRPLRQWCAAGCSPVSAVTLTHKEAALVALRLVPLPGCGDDGQQQPPATVFDAHRTIDALLERCRVLEKVKTAGDTVLAWRPVAGCESLLLPQLSGCDEPVTQTVCASLVAELLFVAEALHNMGWGARVALHIGPVVGAVLGTQRLSLDLLGPAADFTLVACDVISGCEDAAADADVHEPGTVDFVNLPSDAARKMLTSDVVARRRAHPEAAKSAVAISYAFAAAAGFDEAYSRLQVPTWSHAAEESVVSGASRVLSMTSFEVLRLRPMPAFPGCSAGALLRVSDWAAPAAAQLDTAVLAAEDVELHLQPQDQEPMTPVE